MATTYSDDEYDPEALEQLLGPSRPRSVVEGIARPGPSGFDRGLYGDTPDQSALSQLLTDRMQENTGPTNRQRLSQLSPSVDAGSNVDVRDAQNTEYLDMVDSRIGDPRSDPNLPQNGGGIVNTRDPVGGKPVVTSDETPSGDLSGDSIDRGDKGPAVTQGTGDTSGWDTDGYAVPGYTAQNFGVAPDGYDREKWKNPNHQTPKYVVARLQAEAGGDKAKFAQLLAQAYPGATFDGKDKIAGIPGIGTVDVYGGASAGQNFIRWGVDEGGAGTGGGPDPFNNGPTLVDTGGVIRTPHQGGTPTMLGDSTYQKLLKALRDQNGDDPEQAALAKVLG